MLDVLAFVIADTEIILRPDIALFGGFPQLIHILAGIRREEGTG